MSDAHTSMHKKSVEYNEQNVVGLRFADVQFCSGAIAAPKYLPYYILLHFDKTC